MQNQEPGNNLFCIYRDCEDLALFGDYCKVHQFHRAEAAEACAAAKSELIDTIIATWEQMTERLLDSEARAAQLETDNDEMQSYINEIRVALHTEKDELTIEAVRRVIFERDELARKLEQAHNRERMNLAMMTEASAKIEELRQEARDSARRIVELLDSVQA